MGGLAAQPRPLGTEKLSGRDLYRVRQGSYRILYEIFDRDLTVLVIKIGHRPDVYR
jgi:mRNA interferase RelE/StbE